MIKHRDSQFYTGLRTGHHRTATHTTVETASGLSDPSQMQQIMMNLCANVFHAMANTGGTLDNKHSISRTYV